MCVYVVNRFSIQLCGVQVQMLALLNINVTSQETLHEDLKVLHHLKLFCEDQESNPVGVAARQCVISYVQALRFRPLAV